MAQECSSLALNWVRYGLSNRHSSAVHFFAPFGNRVYKKSTASGNSTERKYVVDIAGNLPTILLEINPSIGSLTKTYIYANCEILAQHDGDTSDDKYFYLHDRLGSVRLVINDSGNVVKYYTYEPFGELIEDAGTFDNAFRFTGQYFDAEIEEYYLRARQYNPAIARFTARDPAYGQFDEPLTLHEYLYCLHDPINLSDPSGNSPLTDQLVTASTYAEMGSNAYDASSTILSYARMVANGASLHYILTSVAIEVGMEVAGGALFDALTSAGGKLMRNIRAGNNSIYRSVLPDGTVQYIGRTNDIARRAGEHLRLTGIDIEAIAGLGNLSLDDARGVEQALIERYGLDNLLNQRNSVSSFNKRYKDLKRRGMEILDAVGI